MQRKLEKETSSFDDSSCAQDDATAFNEESKLEMSSTQPSTGADLSSL